jgi:hypothetical protein
VPATPKEMVDIMVMYEQTLRKGYDDKTCGELLRATMAAYLPADEKLGSRIFDKLERSFSKIFFLLSFIGGDQKKAAELGVKITPWDWAVFVGCGAYIGARKTLYGIANSIPGVREATDRMLVKKIERMLASYGHAAHTSDATQYKPAVARPQAAE